MQQSDAAGAGDVAAVAMSGKTAEEVSALMRAYQAALVGNPIPFPSDPRVQLAVEFLRTVGVQGSPLAIPGWAVVVACEICVAAMLQREIRTVDEIPGAHP